MAIKISATRMMLLRLKKRLVLAKRGHKLLKDKQDELVRQFLIFIRDAGRVRKEVEARLERAYATAKTARMEMPGDVHETAVSAPLIDINLEEKQRRIMNILVPEFSPFLTGERQSFGFLQTSASLDRTADVMADAFENIVNLAALERAVMLLAVEIESVRRRVNALEYVLIPEISAGVREITMKLSEMERSTVTRLMRVKQMLEEKAS